MEFSEKHPMHMIVLDISVSSILWGVLWYSGIEGKEEKK